MHDEYSQEGAEGSTLSQCTVLPFTSSLIIAMIPTDVQMCYNTQGHLVDM